MNSWDATATAMPEAMTSAERLIVDLIVIFYDENVWCCPALTPTRQLVAVVRFHLTLPPHPHARAKKVSVSIDSIHRLLLRRASPR
jgi:hypothetical protein